MPTSIGTVKVNDGYVHDFWFDIEPQLNERVTESSSGSNVTINDLTFLRDEASTVVSDYQIPIEIKYNNTSEEYTPVWASDNELVATVSNSGLVTYVSDGSATISCTIGDITRSVTLTLTETAGALSYTWQSAAVGSAKEAAISQFTSLLAAGSDKEVYSTSSHPTYVRNTNCWLYDLDLTGICVYPSKRGGTAVTPRHLISAKHYTFGVGAVRYFLTSDNVLISRTVTHQVNNPAVDLTISLLDSDLPDSIQPLQVLPVDWKNYMPATLGPDAPRFGFEHPFTTTSEIHGLPAIQYNQFRQISTSETFGLNRLDTSVSNHSVGQYTLENYPPIDSNSPNWTETILYDSGQPKLTTFDGENLVLIFVNYTASAGYSLSKDIGYVDDLIKQVDTLAGINSYDAGGAWASWTNEDGSYVSKGYDLSSYTDYS